MKRILVVEDNKPIRDLVTYILEQAGHDVSAASEADQGLLIASDLEPDLVLMDLDLGRGKNGFEALEELRKGPGASHAKVVAFTAFAMAADRERALQAGFDGFIAKPIDPDSFADEIQELLAS